jgi:hypothetical protein
LIHLEHKDIIDRPLEEVYNIVKNELPKIVPFLPNIEKIEVKSLKEEKEGQETHIINHWYGKAEIPPVAQKFVKKELFSWKDTAIWNNKDHQVDYKLESFWANDLYEAKGCNKFRAISPNQTELIVICDIEIHPDKVPGVPRFLVKQVLPSIEDLLKKFIGPNIMSLGKGLKGYFDTSK